MAESRPLVLSATQNFIAGWLAAATARTVVCPLENVKVQMQCSDEVEDVAAVVHQMYKAEGPAAFFKGNLVGILRVPFYSYSQWLSIQTLQSLFQSQFGDPTGFWDWLIIVLGGEFATVFTIPFDAVKTRLQFSEPVAWGQYDCPLCFIRANAKRAWGCAVSLVREEGWGTLFAGLLPAVLAHVPQAATRWTAQKYIPRLLGMEESKAQPLFALALGCASMAIAETVWLPLDTIRRRRQKGDRDAKRDSLPKALRSVYAKKGALGLWSGAKANFLRIAPYNATLVGMYDVLSWTMTQ
eukprot:GGOE01020644.1.p1 GENE.GGOE01020644.1~~GGOE01020644.1.p1  ORF type:complete len:316 (+),score=100.14 GGOE01020644.1:58-948(+)